MVIWLACQNLIITVAFVDNIEGCYTLVQYTIAQKNLEKIKNKMNFTRFAEISCCRQVSSKLNTSLCVFERSNNYWHI